MKTDKAYLQPLGTLQLLAIIMVVIGHFWVKENEFMNSVGVSFCFVYSGFFTAMRHPFGREYGWSDHCRFMWNKFGDFFTQNIFTGLSAKASMGWVLLLAALLSGGFIWLCWRLRERGCFWGRVWMGVPFFDAQRST